MAWLMWVLVSITCLGQSPMIFHSHDNGLNPLHRNALALGAFIGSFPIVLASTDPTCYYPDATDAELDYPYIPVSNDTDGYQACCIRSEGDQLVAGNLCYFPSSQDATLDTGDYIYRGACTDQTFTDEACPKLCLYNTPNRWERLLYCGGTSFCCQMSAENGSCCAEPDLLFDYDPGAKIRAKLAIDAPSTSTSDLPGATHAAASLSATITGFGYPSSISISVSVSNPTAQPATTSSSDNPSKTPTPITSEPAATSTSTSGSDDRAQIMSNRIALGVGIGLGLPTAVAAILALWWTHQDRREKKG